jgi:hypothetical protein
MPPADPNFEKDEPKRRKPIPKRRDEEDEDDYDDDEDDRPRRRSDGGMSTLIPYRNGMALAGYYCSVFSLIPCLALILGPLAIIFGILGLRTVRANPEAKGTAHAIVALVLGGLTTLGNIGLLLFLIGGAALSR